MANFEMPLRLYMQAPLITLPPETPLREAHRRMHAARVSGLPVQEEDGKLTGVVSRTDLLKVGRLQAGARPDARLLALPDQKVAEIMTPDPVVLDIEAPLSRAASTMLARRIHRVYVEEEGKPVGVVSTREIQAALRDKRVNKPVSEYMSSPVFTIRAREPVGMATDRLAKAGVSGLVVVDDGWPVGLFTQEEALTGRHLPADTAVEDAMGHALLILSADTLLHRAAAQAGALHVRRIVVMKDASIEGILSGLDLARAAA